jgi:hypothetical protein
MSKTSLVLSCGKDRLASCADWAGLAVLCLALAGCGDFPRPFEGYPGKRALQLAAPPPPRLLVPAPADSLLPDPDAIAWAKAVTAALVAAEIPAFALPAHPHEWVLRLSASLQGTQVTPHYALIDPKGAEKGDVAGQPIAASAWAEASPDLFRHSADAAAPQLVSLLQAVEATLKQSDPNSLYNRPARIFFTGVTGAPGDGDISLARGMRLKIPDTGDQLVDHPGGADFLLRGTVKVTGDIKAQQLVEIHWIVSGPDGKVAGDVAQIHDVPQGTLDHFWGDVAAVVTEEAAGGVHEVITNYSGRRRAS